MPLLCGRATSDNTRDKMIESEDFIVLHGRESSLVFEKSSGGAPLWRYWGPRLPNGELKLASLESSRPVPSFSPDRNIPLSVFPTFGAGWFNQSGLLASRAGRSFVQDFTACSASADPDNNSLRLTLGDDVAKIRLLLDIELDRATDVLSVGTQLENMGDDPLDVQRLASAVLPLPAHLETVRYYTGRHNKEFVPHQENLASSVWCRENRRGLTSHDSFPGAMVASKRAQNQAGEVYAAQLAWSGNHVQTIEALDDGRRQWHLGEWLAPGELRLSPGATMTAPGVLATFSTRGYDGVAQNFHGAIRKRMTWPRGRMKPRRVHLNTWEAVYFDHDLEALTALADAAAEIGVERFVLDDGWFKNRNDDRAGLGDWEPDIGKYPDGLRPLADFVVEKGMEFGLWVEPEMVNPDSDLYRAHPEWALSITGREPITARNQLVLDLSRHEVADYLFTKIDTLLTTMPISYLKWDHNRDLTLAGGADGRAMYRKQTLAAYKLIDRIRTAHRDVEIEACAGGGGRIDAGIAEYTHRFWTSDNVDPVSRLGIQRGFLQFMPPELMGAHVGASPCHATGRSHSLDFRASVAVCGHLGVELDIQTLDAEENKTLKSWIAFYKRHRERLHKGSVWRGEAGEAIVWQAHGDENHWLLFVYCMEQTSSRFPPALLLPMAKGEADYRVQIIHASNAGDRPPPDARLFEQMRGVGAVFSGSWLRHGGLSLPAMTAESCVIFHGKAQ